MFELLNYLKKMVFPMIITITIKIIEFFRNKSNNNEKKKLRRKIKICSINFRLFDKRMIL